MTAEEAGIIVGTIRAAYPRDWSEETRAIYIKMISDLDYKLTAKVVTEWIATNRWLPTIADIRLGVAERVCELPSKEEATRQLKEWISRQCKNANALHPLVKKAALLCGDGYTWRTTDRYSQMVREFKETYQALRAEYLANQASGNKRTKAIQKERKQLTT